MAEGKWTIDDYITSAGESPVRNFISELTGQTKVDAVALIKLLEERGNTLRPPHSRALGRGLFELRKNQVRIFYVFRRGGYITLLDGMLKKQDKIPARVVKRIQRFQQEVLAVDMKLAKDSGLCTATIRDLRVCA